jgi:hypothetical protein
MKQLKFKKGHKNDMFFAVEENNSRDLGRGYLICKIFFNRDKCLNYIEETNYERKNNITITT